ncbi:MAG TPA: class I SAM-dependent methyltransferase [Phycisphaerae bacterium]|nr:class I SAM-dependent methyltransferase [Phycisphaerae bacterium]
MDEQYWDRMARDFDGEIFDVYANDRHGVILETIARHGSDDRTAADLGCGTGRLLPELAESFGGVKGYDISAKCLDIARTRCADLDNVTVARADLTADRPAKVDFAVSVNVAIMPSHEARSAVLANSARCLRPGGHLLLVVPSLESELYSQFRLLQWNLKEGLPPRQAAAEETEAFTDPGASPPTGILCRNGVPTKHYLREELAVTIAAVGLEVVQVGKVEYPWETAFAAPPAWMGEPYPWDWMLLARKG